MSEGLFIFKISILFFFLPITIYNLFNFFNFKGEYKFVLAMGIAPGILSWIYMLLLRFVPHQLSFFYLALTTVPFVFIVLILLKPSSYREFIKEFFILKNLLEEKFNILLVSFFLLFIILWHLNMPLLGNDPLEYFYIAHLIDLKKDISFYPSTSGIDSRGFIAPFTHPIGYPTILAWAELGFDKPYSVFAAKITSFLFMLLILFSATIIQIKEKINPFLFFSFIFLAIPLVFIETTEAHIDSARMLFFFLTTLALYDHIKHQGSLVLVGISAGLSWFFHSSGMLTLLIALGTYGFFSLLKEKISIQRIKSIIFGGIAMCVICAFFIFLDILKIYSVHGKIIGDLENISIINYLSAEYSHYFAVSRDLNSLSEKFYKGFGQLFFNPLLFGFIYWLAVVGSISNFKSIIKNLKSNQWGYVEYSFVIVVCFFTIVFLSILVGFNVFSFNPRYLMQVLPLVSFLGIATLRKWTS